ncbi:MAG: hypothetical protein ACTSQJ_16225 [Promethearchaeota archaeon]
MITTRESINYQFSLIFGYSSPNDLIVGDVIGPGKLTKQKVKELSIEVIKFLRMYNAILRDYTGSELFFIEFKLTNYNKKDAQINIYPKSMLLIPGYYKDCESLMLALKPETGFLDPHKSRESINNISKLFFEVEEFTDVPDLEKDEKEKVLENFVSRFSLKLFGDLLEDKWNKKLIGLSISLPTEKEMLTNYATIKSNVEILWYKSPFEINLSDFKFEKKNAPFNGQIAIEHLKYLISEPSANFIIENTVKLGANLINLANTGTIDESQESVVLFLINQINEKINKIQEPKTVIWVIKDINEILNELKSYFNKFWEYSRDFLSTGEKGDLKDLLEKYKTYILEKGKIEDVNYKKILEIASKSIELSIVKKEKLRAIELSSVLNYFSEIVKNSLNLIEKAIPKYFSRRKLKIFLLNYIYELEQELNKEQKPAKILGQKLIEKFRNFLNNQIEINPVILSREIKYDETLLFTEFKEIVKQNINVFFEHISLNISDLVSFAEVMMDKDNKIIASHIEKFKKFSGELHYLLSYILRYTTITRYIKEESDEEISDPVTFANRFHRFLEKRIGGIKLEWKEYILEWIKDYSKRFFNLENEVEWDLKKIYEHFIKSFEERESKEQNPDNFLNFLDSYIANVSNEVEKEHLIEFFKQFEVCLDIKTEFPKYIKKKIENRINSFSLESEKLIPIYFLNTDKTDNFYNYIKETELKYFSKLIPRPVTLILKHNLTREEKDLFKAELFHVFNFRFWHNNLKIEIADNFKEVYREWVKEL